MTDSSILAGGKAALALLANTLAIVAGLATLIVLRRVAFWIGAAYWFTASTSFANPA